MELQLKAVMWSPVVLCADGHSCGERAAAIAWLAQHGTSLADGLPVAHLDLIPNHVLRSVLRKLAPPPT